MCCGFLFCRLVYMEDKWFRGGITRARSFFSLATRYLNCIDHNPIKEGRIIKIWFLTKCEIVYVLFKHPKSMRRGIQICYPQVTLSSDFSLFDLNIVIELFVCVCVFEVWRLWITWSTWVCKEQNLAHRWEPTSPCLKRVLWKIICWSSSQIIRRGLKAMASQVRKHHHLPFIFFLFTDTNVCVCVCFPMQF